MNEHRRRTAKYDNFNNDGERDVKSGYERGRLMKRVLLIICLCLAISGCSNGSGIYNEKNDLIITIVTPSSTPISNDNPVPKEDSNPIIPEENTNKDIQETEQPTSNEKSDVSTLSDKIICIDPGHGNPEIKGKQEKIAPESDETKPALAFGAIGIATKIPEYEVNMSVSLKLKSLLEEQGCTVILTRQSDNENLGNIDRAIIGNDAKSDLVIRVHADGSENEIVHGASVLYPGSKYISDNDILTTSKSAAQYVHDAIITATGAKPRGIVKRDDLTGFNWSTQTTILVEMGFLSNIEEDKLLNDSTYQDKIANGIFIGIQDYFESTR